ncbi:MAG TPA: hypothetical protein VJ728_15870, partial [Candidatus Binataceae bacterium]|nr:hypothetical protein [Candidatus Binataceae bacterium]
MGFEGWCRDTFGGAGKICKVLAAASLIVMVTAVTSRAGDFSGQPANSLSVTNSVNSSILPQAAPPPAAEPVAGPGAESSWLGG